MGKYNIGEWAKAKTDFERVFHVNIAPFYDGLTTVLFQKICINILIFDDYLHKLYGFYEDKGLSMKEMIFKKYGNEGIELMDKLLP